MFVKQPLNTNFVIWSFICGDHELKQAIKKINPSLLNKPDIYDPLENNLRMEVFKSRRKWIWDNFGNNVSFGLVRIWPEDLKTMYTCFEDVKFDKFVRAYDLAFKTKSEMKVYNEKDELNHKKPYESVLYEEKLKRKLVKDYMKQNIVTEGLVLSTDINNQKNICVALHRAWIMKEKDKYKIMDGTHRLAAYYWSKVVDRQETMLPMYLNAFMWIKS
jgi:hypothetical protein